MKISFLTTLVLATIVCSVGCAGLGKSKVRGPSALKSMFSDDAPEFFVPSSMVSIWKPSTFEKPGTKSIRGFGGRFYFHNARNEPIKVDGTLTIYGYDDDDGETSGQANRKFVFDTKTFQQHHSASGFGDSYSFWVPWDEVGGFEKTITLIPVFKSADGKIPESQPATLRLPGKKREIAASAQDSLYGPGTQVISASGIVTDKPMVQQAVAVDGEGQSAKDNKPQRRETTTLKLSRNLAGRLVDAPAAKRSDAKQERNSETAIDQKFNSVSKRTSPSPAIDGDETEPRRKRPVFGLPGSF